MTTPPTPGGPQVNPGQPRHNPREATQAVGPGDRVDAGASSRAARGSAGQDDRTGTWPDATRDETGPAGGPARRQWCACCGNPLPPPTAQAKKPRKFCRDGDGRYEDSHGITCAELGPAKEKYERVFGLETVPAADLERLGAHLGAARDLLGPASPVAQLLGTVTGTLTGVGERLDGTVADTLADNARLTAEAREARGEKEAMRIERDAANELAREGVLARQRAERDRDRRVRAADDRAAAAEADKRRAEVAQGKAEGERDLYQQQAQRADEAARRDRELLAEVQAKNTELATTVANLRAQLTQQAERADTELQRVRAGTNSALNQLRDATQLQLTQAQADFAERLATEVGRQAAEHTDAMLRLERERAAELAAHHRSADATQRQLEGRLDAAQTGLRGLVHASDRRDEIDPVEQLQHLRVGLADLLTDIGAAPPV